jgi:hypothetical protein
MVILSGDSYERKSHLFYDYVLKYDNELCEPLCHFKWIPGTIRSYYELVKYEK